MRNYSFMQNLSENYSIIQYKKQTRTARKNKTPERKLMQIKKIVSPSFKGGDTISVFLTIFTLFISRYTLSLRCNRLTIRYRII